MNSRQCAERAALIVSELMHVDAETIRHKQVTAGRKQRPPQNLADARHVTRTVLRRVTDMPLEEIGRYVGQASHYATVMNSIRRVSEWPRLRELTERAERLYLSDERMAWEAEDPTLELDRMEWLGARLVSMATFDPTAREVLARIERSGKAAR